MPSVLVVDNHDSFVHNIVQYLKELGADVTTLDRADTTLARGRAADGILISPGPGHPADTGICLDLIGDAAERGRPLLGVCLGHQAIAHFHGAKVGHAPEVVHGYTSEILHSGEGVFHGLPSPFLATRYHSLAVEPATIPDELSVTALTSDGVVMGLRHTTAPLQGVQFHPESILSEHGHRLLATWLTGL